MILNVSFHLLYFALIEWISQVERKMSLTAPLRSQCLEVKNPNVIFTHFGATKVYVTYTQRAREQRQSRFDSYSVRAGSLVAPSFPFICHFKCHKFVLCKNTFADKFSKHNRPSEKSELHVCKQTTMSSPTKIMLLACGSFNPPTPMHLRMFGMSSWLWNEKKMWLFFFLSLGLQSRRCANALSHYNTLLYNQY